MNSRSAEVPCANLEPGFVRIFLARVGAPYCGLRDEPRMAGQRLDGACGSFVRRAKHRAVRPLRLARKKQMRKTERLDVAAVARGCARTRSLHGFSAWKFSRRSRFGGKAAGRLANAAPLLGWLPATPATAAHASRAAASAAATRGSASSSAAAAACPWLCAKSSGVMPLCSRGDGRGAGRKAGN